MEVSVLRGGFEPTGEPVAMGYRPTKRGENQYKCTTTLKSCLRENIGLTIFKVLLMRFSRRKCLKKLINIGVESVKFDVDPVKVKMYKKVYR